MSRISKSLESLEFLFRLELGWHVSITGERTHTWRDVTSHLTEHLARRLTLYSFFSFFLFAPFSLALLSRRDSFSPNASRRIRKDNPPRVNPPFALCAFYFTTLCANCRRIGNSTGSPACCAPPGDELLLSRASRSRVRTLCGLSSPSRGTRPRKVQIAKNNIALGWRGRK